MYQPHSINSIHDGNQKAIQKLYKGSGNGCANGQKQQRHPLRPDHRKASCSKMQGMPLTVEYHKAN